VTAQLDLPGLVRGRRVIVCCGSGGVGKTTSAAALGVLAARHGVDTLVMTIDPARRLAQAMGIETLEHEPRRIPLAAPGALSAMMLDSKRTFDGLVERLAPDARIRDTIFANHYYQQLSTALGGSRELVAMEQVLETVESGAYRLLIVDTPPSQHALDFLDAPARLVGLLDGSMTSLLLRPYGAAARAQFRFFQQSSRLALGFMERLTGVQALADLSEFLLAFSGLFDDFRERSHRVRALMREPTTAFLLVCTPEPASLRQVARFAARLDADGLETAGVLANRVHAAPAGAVVPLGLTARDRALLEAVSAAGGAAEARLAAVWRDVVELNRADEAALAGMIGERLPVHRVARYDRDLRDLSDLEMFASALEPGAPGQP
jgi:anion-transporting  ArsA/GET3 family ATPase